MPNKSKINQELVKVFNNVLLFGNTVITNLTIEKDHLVLSFDKNMNIDRCEEYLRNMRESIVRKFCGDEGGKAAAEEAVNDLFYKDSFPFNFDQKKWTTDSSRHRFSVPIEKEVVCNLKYLLANELIRFIIESIIDDHPKGPDYVENNVYDLGFDRKYYLYCKGFDKQELKESFVKLFSSIMESYENSPKNFKNFLKQEYFPKDEKTYVYLKKGVFDDLKFVKDILKRRASSICRSFDTPKGEIEAIDMLKFAVVDLFRKANISVVETERASYSDSDEDSVLIPIVSGSNGDRYLTKEEAKYVNNISGMVILNNVEGHVSQKLKSDSQGVYAIDCANQDIAYCVMDKITKSSLISEYKVKNKKTGEIKYKLSIDPARVPAMKPQTLASNASKFLSHDYYGEDKGRDDASAKDSGISTSSARSSFNDKPRPILDQPSVLQSEQCSTKKRTSVGKNTSCCIL